MLAAEALLVIEGGGGGAESGKVLVRRKRTNPWIPPRHQAPTAM